MPCRVDLLRLRMHGFRSNENRTTAQNQRYCTRLLNNQRSEADCTTPETLPSVCKRLLKMTSKTVLLGCCQSQKSLAQILRVILSQCAVMWTSRGPSAA